MNESINYHLGNIKFPLSKQNRILFDEFSCLLKESKHKNCLKLTSLQMHQYADFVALIQMRSKIQVQNNSGTTQYTLREPNFQEHEYPATTQAFIEWVYAQDKTAREEKRKAAFNSIKPVVISAFVGAITTPLINGLFELTKIIVGAL